MKPIKDSILNNTKISIKQGGLRLTVAKQFRHIKGKQEKEQKNH